MKLVLQYTTGAFSGEIPESAWRTAEGHYRKVHTAKKALDQARAEMRERCGPTAWDCHYRLLSIGTLPIRLTATVECHGSYRTHERHEECMRKVELAWFWEPGEPEPPKPRAEGWHGTTCPKCNLLDAEHERKEDARLRRELTRRGY